MAYYIGIALLLLGTVVPAGAAPLIDWDPAFYYHSQPSGPHGVPAGGNAFVVGEISVFGGALSVLNPNIALGTEYTFYMAGMSTTVGTTTTNIPTIGEVYTTIYDVPGTIEVWEDAPANIGFTPANFTPNPPNGDVPSKFTDGTLILSGTVNNFYWQSNNFTLFMSGISEADITWTGGTLLDLLRPPGGGDPCTSLYTGGITWLPSLLIDGYLFRHDGKIDLECPTGTARTSTWGRLKSLYR
jgi:hypothetical protein